jgi:hypothetical protein
MSSYTSQQFLLFDNGSNANYRSWGSAISAAIAAMGWVQTGDTGQVNWTTVTAPGTNTYNYEIWTPGASDAFQTGATAYYLKVEYGNGASANQPDFKMSIGTGTNGAGTLTGFTMGPFGNFSSNTGGQGSVTYECNFSGDYNRMGINLWRNGGNICKFLGVERTKDSSGNDNGEGVNLVAVTFSGRRQWQTIAFGVATGNLNAGALWNILGGNSNGDEAFNNAIPISPIFPNYGKIGNPMTIFGIAPSSDVAEGCYYTTTLYGATRTYLASKITNSSANCGGSNTALLMRYD